MSQLTAPAAPINTRDQKAHVAPPIRAEKLALMDDDVMLIHLRDGRTTMADVVSAMKIKQEAAAAAAAAAARKAVQGSLRCKVSETTGVVSLYGLTAKYPTSLYADQWPRLLDFGPQILQFIADNSAEIAARETAGKAAKAAAKAEAAAVQHPTGDSSAVAQAAALEAATAPIA